ncbi:hypothetical protein T05_26 [Trichinella murrelli]|uniref:Uncharacterized protein n=1 Tax=Trichinella murrelli TaxID=144512 RepID=A0A0V0T9D3_9BILA|nr:hypothetical protein T05_26 [Trichinella murrelli]
MGRARRITTPIHHTNCYPMLSSLFLPPVDLQKGERDTQVQFRGRVTLARRRAAVPGVLYVATDLKTSSEGILRQKECLCSRRRPTTNNCCASLDKEDEEEEQSSRILTDT